MIGYKETHATPITKLKLSSINRPSHILPDSGFLYRNHEKAQQTRESADQSAASYQRMVKRLFLRKLGWSKEDLSNASCSPLKFCWSASRLGMRVILLLRSGCYRSLVNGALEEPINGSGLVPSSCSTKTPRKG